MNPQSKTEMVNAEEFFLNEAKSNKWLQELTELETFHLCQMLDDYAQSKLAAATVDDGMVVLKEKLEGEDLREIEERFNSPIFDGVREKYIAIAKYGYNLAVASSSRPEEGARMAYVEADAKSDAPKESGDFFLLSPFMKVAMYDAEHGVWFDDHKNLHPKSYLKKVTISQSIEKDGGEIKELTEEAEEIIMSWKLPPKDEKFRQLVRELLSSIRSLIKS